MASVALGDCLVEPGFDPLSPEFLSDSFAVMHPLDPGLWTEAR